MVQNSKNRLPLNVALLSEPPWGGGRKCGTVIHKFIHKNRNIPAASQKIGKTEGFSFFLFAMLVNRDL